MITYLDTVIPVFVAREAIFLVAALVFRLREVGRQKFTLVDGNLSDFDFWAETLVVMRSSKFHHPRSAFSEQRLDQPRSVDQEQSELHKHKLWQYNTRGCILGPKILHRSVHMFTYEKLTRTSVYLQGVPRGEPRLKIQYRLLIVGLLG
jgi:hypothetical protein